jgi:hypothetical protein
MGVEQRTLFTLTVDTEEEWDWDSGYPTGPGRVTNIRRLPAFQAACDKHGVAVTYFTNHAVLADADGRSVIRELASRPNVEIGFHIHPWNTPPLQPVERVSPRESFLHNLPEALALAKLETVYAAFRDAGLTPTSYRGGRYSTSPAIQDWLRGKGFVADASVLPYSTWKDDGAPDYRHRGLLPERKPGDPGLWEVPLTFGYTRRPFGLWRRAFGTIENTPLRHLRLVGILGKLGVAEKSWLNFENPLGERMSKFLAVLRPLRLPCVCFTLHSSSLMAGGNGYTRTGADERRLFAALDRVFGELRTWPEFDPATVSAVARQLEIAHNARHRD